MHDEIGQNLILTFPKNAKGRDFVVGDLHGTYSLLERFMEHVSFDTEKDRMFSVGDLVDRGPHSVDCFNLVFEPWFFAVRGNHEQMFYDAYFGGPTGKYWANNGGMWEGHTNKMAYEVNHMPFMITVKKQDDTFFHVIHAEFSNNVVLTDELLKDPNVFLEACFGGSNAFERHDTIMWGRFIFQYLYGKELTPHNIEKFKRKAMLTKYGACFSDELSPIYSGHTILQNPVRFMKQTNIDTGACFGGESWSGLTVTEPLTDKFWKVTRNGIESENLLIVV